MRAIISREHKRALAERRQAEADRREASGDSPPSAGWSRKPDPARKPGAADKSLSDRAEQNREAWARRHPTAAKAERKLRKGRAVMLDAWSHKNAGTPETHDHASRRNQGALVRLYRNEEISADQLAAAVAIAEVVERIGAEVALKTASLETRIDVTRLGDGTFYERLALVRREVAYTRWRNAVVGPIGAVLAMIAGDSPGGDPVGLTIVAKRYRMHNRKAKRLLIDALDLWPKILSQTAREIDDATLAAAHAGILG
jgi:hypothetical protein